MARKILTAVLSILLAAGAAAIPPAQDSFDVDANRNKNFLINPQTGQITIRDRFAFPEVMAAGVGADIEGEGYVEGKVLYENGRHTIVIRLDTIKDPALRQRWEGPYLAEYIRTRFSNLETARDFHGAEVRVGQDARGYFDWRNGLTPNKPPEIPAAQGTSAPPAARQGLPPEPTEDFFPSRPQRRPARARTAAEDQISFAKEPAMPPEEPRAAARPAPGPVKPELEKQISDMLAGADPGGLKADIAAGRWEFFRRPLFNPPEGPAETARAWKKVSSLPQFSEHSKMLAEMRWKMVADLWAEVSRDHQVRIELIDSGKRNAYRSDIDLTVYSPAEGRGGLAIESLIKDFEGRFERLTGYKPANIDITLHNGDVFIPDVRSRGQSYREYSTSLRKAVRLLRLKVTSGGDAYCVPGSNLETVQKRALVQGRVTIFDPRMDSTYQPGVEGLLTGRTRNEARSIKKPNPEELPILRLDPNAGKWKVNSTRFEGVIPSYDPGNKFAIMVENLRQILLHGDDPVMASKYFNLAVNKGAGMGQVNNFMDIYALKPDAAINGDMFLEAFELESGKPFDAAYYRSMSSSAHALLLRCRWLIRTFNLDPSMPPQAILELYEVVNISTAIEHAKITDTLNWEGRDGRSVYLKRYFVEATENVRQAMPDFNSLTDEAQGKAIYGEAWRIHCKRLRNVLTSAMVTSYARALADMTPQGMKRNSFRFMTNPEDGTVSALPDTLAAAKLAEQRRVELALGFEIINKIEPRLLREELIQEMINKTPQELKAEVERLAKMTVAELDDFLSDSGPDDGPPGPARRPVSEVIAEKRRRVRQVSPEISEEEAGRRLQDPRNQARLNEHIQRGAQLRSPADAPAIKRIFSTIEGWTAKKAAAARRAVPEAMRQADAALLLPPGEYWNSIMNNLSSPLMLTSSAVNILRAYQTGDPQALRESILSEAIFFLPPAYGVAGIAIKDFTRGKYGQGLIALGMLGTMHYVSKYWIPGAGQYLLAYSIAKGVPELAYYFVVNRMEEDIFLQAFRSRPDADPSDGGLGRRRAQKSPPPGPQSVSSRIGSTDPPMFPILYDNACMKAKDDDTSMADLTSMARRLWAPFVLKELIAAGLEPDSAEWKGEHERLMHKYAFDTPYYQRMENIHKCFYPEVKSRLLPDDSTDSNEEEVLQSVFGKVVSDWLKKQPEPYQSQFDSVFDFLGGSSRKTILDRMASHLIGLYRHYEQLDVDAILQEAQRARKLSELLEEQLRLEMQLLASKDVQLNRIEEGFQSLFANVLRRRTPSRPRVKLVVPDWYLDMSGFVTNEPGADAGEPATQAGAETDWDAAGIPVAIDVAADRADFPEPWSHDYELKFESIMRGAPEGFAPGAEEKRKLDEKDETGQPKNEIFTVRLNAKGSVFDRDGKPIGETQSAAVVGYLIAPIPRVSGSAEVKITAMRPAAAGKRIPEAVVCRVTLDNQAERESSKSDRAGEEGTSALFQDVRAGSHTITVTPLSPDWREASASFEIRDPYSREAYASAAAAAKDKFPVEVRVSLAYKGKMPEPERRQDEPAAETSAGKAASAASTGAQAPGLSADCGSLIGWARMMRDLDPRMAAAYLAQYRQKCGTPPADVEGPLRQQEQQSLAAATQAIGGIEALMGRCEFEQALGMFNGLAAAVRSHPTVVSWTAGNLAALQAAAAAQARARAFVRAAREAILARDTRGASASLAQALAVANLPECMRSQIAPLFEELNSLAQSKGKGAAPPAVAASKPGGERVVVRIGSLVDSHEMKPYRDRSYMLLRSKASVVAQVIYNDGAEELKSGEPAFNDCLRLGYYRYMPELGGYVRTGLAYSETKAGRAQPGSAAAGSGDEGDRPGPQPGGGEAGEAAGGGTGSGPRKTGDGNSLLGVEYVTREDMYNGVNESTRKTLDEMERRSDEAGRTCSTAVEGRFKKCNNAAVVRDFEGNIDVRRTEAREAACRDRQKIEQRVCNDEASRKHEENEKYLERSYEEQVERPKQRRSQ